MDVRSPNQGIIIVPDGNSCKGSGFNDPIEIDDEVEFLGVLEMSRGSSRKHPIVVEQEGLHQAWAPNFLRLKPKRSRSFKKPLVESPWAGKPVFEIGESSGTSLQENLEMEFGVSSGSFPIRLEPDFNCEICMESKYPNELFAIEGCSHIYCKSCVSQYVAAKVEENVLFIKCPDPNCVKGKLEPAMCSRILEDRVFDLWCKALCELMVNDKFYCPFKDCSALMINDEEEVITDAECPHCSRLFCAQCRVPWHEGLSCDEFQSLGKNDRKIEDLMLMKLAKESKWQRCPKCKFFVERSDGCVFITCRCRFTFCYGCASEMKTNHYCEKCKR
ncbi:probable E3 ubiquitin-protein ligase RNF144A-B isoform X1 [Dendrobium catenatum]|uniref:RBR-type E3 ubiquitin transferase n=1 Tax=Dendrobium catenatum TaxID=906689 RepID=A0A2I0WDS2_9ASPA|nr:probable E3 ubiquitin-protein ligase RNF144A-B isoform X1 [Dendrobium catenatum]PKU73819.1 putative E3 ubiquitin-protein ligase ARI9 [Dendrobium catenatum]